MLALSQIVSLFLIAIFANSDALLSQPLTVRWRYQSNVTNLTPAFDNERIYIPIAGGQMVALKAKDGQLFWRAEIGGEIFAGGLDGRAYAFDKRTGGVMWSIPYSLEFSGQPVVKDGKVYLGSEDGTLLALDEASGSLLWRYRTQGAIHGPVAVTKTNVFFGSGDGYVYSLSTDKGKLQWRKRTGAGVEAVVLAGDSILAASLDNFAYLLNLKGAMLWKKQLPGRISAQPLAVAETALFTPLSSSEAVVLGLKDGKQVNTLVAGEELTSSASPIIVGDAVILTTEHGLLAFARPADSASKPNYE